MLALPSPADLMLQNLAKRVLLVVTSLVSADAMRSHSADGMRLGSADDVQMSSADDTRLNSADEVLPNSADEVRLNSADEVVGPDCAVRLFLVEMPARLHSME